MRNMVARCGIGCDHGQMWLNDAIMQDAVQLCKVSALWCDCIMWPNIWCGLKCGVSVISVKCGAMWNVM